MAHVLILPSWYKGTYNSNNGSFIREQAHALKRAGHRVGIIHSNLVYWYYITGHKKLHNLSMNSYVDEGIPTYLEEVLQIPIKPRVATPIIRRVNMRNNFYSWKRLFLKYIEENGQPEIIHCHSYYPRNILAYIKSQHQIPIVLTEHWSGYGYPDKVRARFKWIEKSYVNSDHFIAVSDILKDKMKEYFNVDAQVIPNGINFNNFKVSTAKHDKFTFLAIGYLHPRKRIDLLLRKFSKAFGGSSEVQLRILGDGELRGELENLKSELGLDNSVAFLGSASRQEVAEETGKAHVLVSTSEFETFGVTLIEGLASGIPVLSTDSGGPQSIIKSPTFGFLVDQDGSGIDEKMRWMAEHYQSFDAHGIREGAAGLFCENNICSQITKVYCQALEPTAK